MVMDGRLRSTPYVESARECASWPAFARGACARGDVWVTSKLWNTDKSASDVEGALRRTLRDLKLSYVDLYLIHWPIAWGRKPNCACHAATAGSGALCPFPKRDDGGLAYADVPLEETWRALERCVDAGLCRHIGVSNFNADQLAELLALPGGLRHRPAVNQVELHPHNASAALCGFCAARGVVLTAYSCLGHGSGADGVPLLESPAVLAAAARNCLTPAQVLIRLHVDRGIAALPKSVTPARIASNLEAANAAARRLPAEDVAALLALDVGWRFCANLRDKHLAAYPFKDELPALLRHAKRAKER